MGYAKRNVTVTHSHKKTTNFSIIIPCAGVGIRAQSKNPKNLLNIHDTSIINRQLYFLNKLGNVEIILVGGFGYENLLNNINTNNIKTIYNPNYITTNVVNSISIGLKHTTTDKVIIVYGDLIFNHRIFPAPFDTYSTAVICNTMKKEEVGCLMNNNVVDYLFYDFVDKWAQIIYLTGDELKMFTKLSNIESNNNKFGFEIINQIIELGGRIKVYKPYKGIVVDIDTQKDLKIAHQLIS